MIEYFKSKDWKSYSILLIIAIIISIPLFHTNFDIKGWDGILHISRLMGTFQAITDGQLFPNIMYHFCNGFGYNWNIFYSPLTVYLPLIFKVLTDSFVVCLKLFMFFTVLLSGFFMHKFVKEITNSSKIGLLAGIIYMTLPYRLTDMYIRMAISELASFVFFPLIFLGLNNIINKNIKKDYYLAIGAIGLLLTHNISTLVIAIFCFIFLLCNIKKINKQVIKILLINSIFIITITSFFWLPMLEIKSATLYEVFILDRMGSVNSVAENGISFINLIFTKFNAGFVFEIGLPILLFLLTSICCFKKIPKEYKNIYSCFIVFGVLSMFMATKYFPWRMMPFVCGMIQFPTRMLTFAGFFLSFVCAVNIWILLKQIKSWHIIIVCVIFLGYACILIPHLKYDENFNELDYWYGEYVTGNNQNLNSGCASFEYLPAKAQNHKDYIAIRDKGSVILSGEAIIENETKDGTHMIIDIKDVRENTYIELPYIYYPGYEVELMTENERINIEITESENGFLGIQLPEIEKGFIQVSYTGTRIMKVTAIISVLSLISFIVYIIKRKKK